jgi:uncharacterized protein (DUF1015 family)
MATVRPFRGYRPLPEYASHVAARPYDVLSSEEARVEAAGNPVSFLHVGKPEIDLPPGTDLYDESVYRKGKENLQRLIDQGILREDDQPCFYLYAQTMGEHTQYGIVGCDRQHHPEIPACKQFCRGGWNPPPTLGGQRPADGRSDCRRIPEGEIPVCG